MTTTFKEAILSKDLAYRYHLSRSWSDGSPVTFVMLNPSTANDQHDDPTLRRCIAFAQSWGFGSLEVVNLYALRATNPLDLWESEDPIGPENDHYLEVAASNSELLVAAWGAHAKPTRVQELLQIPGFEELTCLRKTKRGAPSHPLYLPKTLVPIPWNGSEWAAER